MRKLLAALLLVAAPAFAQATNGWAEIQNGWGEIQTATGGSTVPASCTTAGMVPIFLGSPVAMGCDAGLTYDAVADTLTVGEIVMTQNVYSRSPAYLRSFGDNPAGVGLLGPDLVTWRPGIINQNPDSGFRRVSPGLVGVTDGSTGNGALQTGGVQYVTGSRPTCDAAARGMTWYVAGGAGVADTIEICAKASADTYGWNALAVIP